MLYTKRIHMSVHVIKKHISKDALAAIANEDFGDMVKGVVDVAQEIMTLGGELHIDGETVLILHEGSLREHTWGINLYPGKSHTDWLEFNSMVNLTPALENRSRGVESEEVRRKIRDIVDKLLG